MKDKWNVGLLGAGFIVEAHAQALKTIPAANLIAVCDQSKKASETAARTYAIPNYYTSLDKMLESEVEVVHVLLPPNIHFDISRKIIESGRHVFLEKPMGLSASECQNLVDLASQNKVKICVNHNFLFLSSYELLRKHARDGTLGNIDQVTINWLYPLGLIQFGPFDNWMFRDPRNLFYELGPHLVAYMLDLGGEIDEIQADVFNPVELPGGNRIFSRWHIHCRSKNKAMDLNISLVPGNVDRSIAVRGRAAISKCDFDRDIYFIDEPSGYSMLFNNYHTLVKTARQISKGAFRNLVHGITGTLRKLPSANPFGESIGKSVRAFYGALNGNSDPRIDGEFGVRVIDACDQILEKISFPENTGSNQSWTVLAPLKQPEILVVGGTGFIGKYLVKTLTDAGHGVRVITRKLSSGQIALAGQPVELMQGDLNDESFLNKALEGIECVYHLGKVVGNKWEDYYNGDVMTTKKLARLAQSIGIKRFIYTGTIDSYYSGKEGEIITADTPLDCNIKTRNHYARSKAACEKVLLDMHAESKFPVVICRPGIVIGKGCAPAHWGVGMFESETRLQYWGDGKNNLPFVLVEDVAAALYQCLEVPDIEGQCILLTDQPLLSGREYVKIVSKELGTNLRASPSSIWKLFLVDAIKEGLKFLIRHPNRKIPSYRDWKSRTHVARYDNSKSTELLGWRPNGTREGLVENGIVAAVRDFK